MRVAVAQTPGTRLDQWSSTLDVVAAQIARAAELGAALVVLPECVWPAYNIGSKAAYFSARAAGMPAPEVFVRMLTEQARARHLAICAGFVGEDADRLFNAACLIDATGAVLKTHHKCFFWNFDHDFFVPGDAIEPIATPWGKTGVMICADARLPEIAATLAARGAGLILQPTAWVNGGAPGTLWNAQADFLISARAAELGIPIISASKWGGEGDLTFVGSSLICDGNGRVLAQCGARETAIAVADVDPSRQHRLEMTPAERARLLSSDPPCIPRADVPPLHVVLCGPGASAGDVEAARRHPARGQSPTLVLCSEDPGRSAAESAELDNTLAVLAGPTVAAFDLAGIRIAAVQSAGAAAFPTVRGLALEGVHVVVLFGDECSLVAARARACENRIFMVVVRSSGYLVIDPRGQIDVQADWAAAKTRPATVRLNVADAAEKCVAPRTDALRGRRPRQYRF